MNKYPVFPNAPITEALLDIRVEQPKELTLQDIEMLHDSIKDVFPEKKKRMSFKANIALPEKSQPTTFQTTGGPDGFLFRSPKENKIVQCRLDGFTFNKLKPYNNWNIFSSEARKLWNLYFTKANPIKVTRIALRYINRIEVPSPIKDFKDYLVTTPEIAPNLPQELSYFFIRLVVPNPEIQANAIITQTIEEHTQDQRIPLILDIDVFMETVHIGNKTEMWDDFKKLREFKNDIFFNNITNKTKEFFK